MCEVIYEGDALKVFKYLEEVDNKLKIKMDQFENDQLENFKNMLKETHNKNFENQDNQMQEFESNFSNLKNRT